MSQYRKGYIFEKKTNAYVQELLSEFNNLKFYVIESRVVRELRTLSLGCLTRKMVLEHGLDFSVKEDMFLYQRKIGKLKNHWTNMVCSYFYSTPMKEKKHLLKYILTFQIGL